MFGLHRKLYIGHVIGHKGYFRRELYLARGFEWCSCNDLFGDTQPDAEAVLASGQNGLMIEVLPPMVVRRRTRR
mgnify:CR=1 FL=1